jgi:hypothetical protein
MQTMKQARLSQQERKPLFLDFVNHYGIVPKPTASDARAKGKVERCVHYLRDNFLNSRRFTSLEQVNAEALPNVASAKWMSKASSNSTARVTKRRPTASAKRSQSNTASARFSFVVEN